MMTSKKGLSGVITTVLLILLILVAIGIMWTFLAPFISNSGSGLEGSTTCLNVNVNPVSCVKTGNEIDGFAYNISVERGADNGELSDIKLILYDSDGNSVVVPETDLPGALETKAYTNLLYSVDYFQVAIGKSVLIGDSEVYICEQVSEKIDCLAP